MWSKVFGKNGRRPDALQTFKTKNLYEAAFLASQGARLLGCERRYRQLIFVLRLASAQEDAIDAVLSDREVSVNIRRFGAAIGTLERRMARWQNRK